MINFIKRGMVRFSILLCCGTAACEEVWELIKDEDGLKIYTREIAGTEIKELRSVGKMKTTVKRLIDIQFDVENQTRWVPLCKSAKLIEKLSDTNFRIYREIDNPWPFKNRDYVVDLDLKMNEKTGEALVEYAEVPRIYPPQECCVRMEKLRGYWKFAPLENGFVEVTYRMHMHPGGESPTAFINMSMAMIGKDTFDALNKYVQVSE